MISASSVLADDLKQIDEKCERLGISPERKFALDWQAFIRFLVLSEFPILEIATIKMFEERNPGYFMNKLNTFALSEEEILEMGYEAEREALASQITFFEQGDGNNGTFGGLVFMHDNMLGMGEPLFKFEKLNPLCEPVRDFAMFMNSYSRNGVSYEFYKYFVFNHLVEVIDCPKCAFLENEPSTSKNSAIKVIEFSRAGWMTNFVEHYQRLIAESKDTIEEYRKVKQQAAELLDKYTAKIIELGDKRNQPFEIWLSTSRVSLTKDSSQIHRKISIKY